MSHNRSAVSIDQWSVVVVDQKESRSATSPKQPLDETKDTRHFIVISPKDNRRVFNCIECTSRKPGQQIQYPQVEITADGKAFRKDNIAHPGMIYTLHKTLEGLSVVGSIADAHLRNRITIAVQLYMPKLLLGP